MVSAPYGSITSEIHCNVANIHNHRHYCKYEICGWHNLRSPRKVFSLIILSQKTSLVYMDGSTSFVTPFLKVALTSALCNLQICLYRKFTFRPPLQDDYYYYHHHHHHYYYHMKCYVLCHKDQFWDHLHFNIVWCGFLVVDFIILLRAIVSS
jgi:hypothetical protein